VTRETVPAKASRLLAAGRVRVVRLAEGTARGTVRGDTGDYDLEASHSGEAWCSCPFVRREGALCSHLIAFGRVIDPVLAAAARIAPPITEAATA